MICPRTRLPKKQVRPKLTVLNLSLHEAKYLATIATVAEATSADKSGERGPELPKLACSDQEVTRDIEACPNAGFARDVTAKGDLDKAGYANVELILALATFVKANAAIGTSAHATFADANLGTAKFAKAISAKAEFVRRCVVVTAILALRLLKTNWLPLAL